jgi:hypothetical protein
VASRGSAGFSLRGAICYERTFLAEAVGFVVSAFGFTTTVVFEREDRNPDGWGWFN